MIDSSITYRSYFVGFVVCIALTLLSYFAVTIQPFTVKNTYAIISLLAIIQIIVQVLYFLHIGSEKGPRWNLISFIFMLVMVLIVVAGSLWVMYNLNVNMM